MHDSTIPTFHCKTGWTTSNNKVQSLSPSPCKATNYTATKRQRDSSTTLRQLGEGYSGGVKLKTYTFTMYISPLCKYILMSISV